MQKIPTLFKREFDAEHRKRITREVTEGCECVLEGRAVPTLKWDGAACAIIGGEIYKRYDAKQKYGKKPPEGAIPCQESPDPITGHWPHWVKCEEGNPADKYFLGAFRRMKELWGEGSEKDGTYEAIGPAWQANPYRLEENLLERHGNVKLPMESLLDKETGKITFDSIKAMLGQIEIEGIVFWVDGKPLCKIKRSDFGYEWPIRGGR